MSLKTDIDNIKNLEQGITNNKVSKFAYTDTAYTNNDVNGVQTYNINNEQNIPVADADVLQVNTTITNKGYRAQASSLTRMLVNHFFGRVSYNLNKINDFFLSFLTSFSSYLGQPNGVATLDENGRIPFSQLPESAVEYKGEWNASTNTPTLVDGTGTNGSMYYVSVGGTQNLGSGNITFLEGDRIIYNGEDEVWQRLSGGTVKSVNSVSPDAAGNVQLSFSNLDGTVTNSQLANDAVTTAKIADSNVTTAKIADANVTTAKIADNAVTNAKFGDVLPISKGGTEQTTAVDACNSFINALAEDSDVPVDNDFFVSQYVNGGTTTTEYYRRPLIKLWTYIQGKISSVLGLTASNYNGTSAKATADGSGNNIASSYALKEGSSSNFQSNTHYFKSLGGWQDQDSVVIPILEITSSTAVNRYSNGKIFSQRTNGAYSNPYFEWYCNKRYSVTTSEKYSLSVKGIFLWEVVTFNYNSKKYLGIAFKQMSPPSQDTYFDGYAYPMEEPLFTIIRYYNNVSGIISQEIYNSLAIITNYSYSGFATTADTATRATTANTATYVVDSNQKLLDWANNVAGNDYSSVLIKKGTWTSSVGVNLSSCGTKVVVGEVGSTLSFTDVENGLFYDTVPTSSEYYMLNVNVNNNTSGAQTNGFSNCTNLTNCTGTGNGYIAGSNNSRGTGFSDCTNLTNCTGNGTGTGIASGNNANGIGFFNCTNLTNCTGTGTGNGTGNGNGFGIGFFNCTNLTNCTGTGTSTSTGRGSGKGFSNCKGVSKCKAGGKCTTSVFDTCYASQSSKSTYACADTPEGGFNDTTNPSS